MNLKLSRVELLLAPHQTVGLVDAVGAHVEVRRGKVWITQHEDGRDLMVAAGGGFTLDRPGLALVHALEPTEMALAEGGTGTARLKGWKSVPRAVLRAIGRWIAWNFGPEAIDRYRPGPWHRGL
jgi:Protein of unknown function (DUF2917)